MKAKDIALLCTAAAGAGAVAGAVAASPSASAGAKKAQPRSQSRVKNQAAAKRTASEGFECMQRAETMFPDGLSSPRIICTDSAGGLAAAVFGENNCRAFILRPDGDGAAAEEIRCPTAVTGAAVSDKCVFFITPRGGVCVYPDPEKEPVMCALTDPGYVCSIGGKFCVFSDSLLYVCTDSGEIEKTVSLSALAEISGSDICDAESTDGGFSSARVTVKKMQPFGKGGFFAVITDDGRSFLMHSEDGDFYSFEKTYESILDVCVYEKYAYYLCRLSGGYGIIKTAVTDKKCETISKFFLCPPENIPVRLYGGICGLGVLFSDGSIRFLLPEIASERRREKCRKELAALSGAFEGVCAEDIFTLGSFTAYFSGGRLYTLK